MSNDLDALASNTVTGRSTMSKDELDGQLAALGARWSIEGSDLKCTLKGPKGMARAGAAVAYALQLADEMDHHPHVVMDYPETVMTIHTHDKKAITLIDFVWAARVERWLRENGW
ncbi:MAG: 4a-hydroxytetrahydrobiopterin dehydratase [Kofleriaceae bacterium]